MPAVPTLIADLFEPCVGRKCRVSRVDLLDARLRRIQFAGAARQGLAFRPGQEVEFRVDDPAFRHYTPVAYDRAAGTADIVFYLHDTGPGSRWVRELASVPLGAVTRTSRGQALHAWLDAAKLAPNGDTAIYLAGHAASISLLRDNLRDRGWPRSVIRTKRYWADGKRGL